jgi:branched-chain amino acid transport system substrate-binding protein
VNNPRQIKKKVLRPSTTEVVKDTNGDLVSKVVQVVPNVDQRLGFSKEVFDRIGLPAREVPVCKKNYD